MITMGLFSRAADPEVTALRARLPEDDDTDLCQCALCKAGRR